MLRYPLNPAALRMVQTLWSSGHSECKRVNLLTVIEYIFFQLFVILEKKCQLLVAQRVLEELTRITVRTDLGGAPIVPHLLITLRQIDPQVVLIVSYVSYR